jgi:hypothetical protein
MNGFPSVLVNPYTMPPKKKAVEFYTPPSTPPTYFARLPADLKEWVIEELERSEFPTARRELFKKIINDEKLANRVMEGAPDVVFEGSSREESRRMRDEMANENLKRLKKKEKRVDKIKAHIKKQRVPRRPAKK